MAAMGRKKLSDRWNHKRVKSRYKRLDLQHHKAENDEVRLDLERREEGKHENQVAVETELSASWRAEDALTYVINAHRGDGSACKHYRGVGWGG